MIVVVLSFCSSVTIRGARVENRALNALHERPRPCGRLHSFFLQIIDFLKLFLNPGVPQMERNLLLLALSV